MDERKVNKVYICLISLSTSLSSVALARTFGPQDVLDELLERRVVRAFPVDLPACLAYMKFIVELAGFGSQLSCDGFLVYRL